jgi:hypothetical protein
MGRQLLRRAPGSAASLLVVLVVAAVTIVHVLRPRAGEAAEALQLPQHVADLRDAILTAARSGNIEELKVAFDVSGAVPDFGIGGMNDPIRALKAASDDGQGREILAALIEVLSLPPATSPFGSDIENNLIYVWPYLAERQLDKLTPAEDVDLYRLVDPAKASEMHEKRRWMWWRLTIAADGTWLAFKRQD